MSDTAAMPMRIAALATELKCQSKINRAITTASIATAFAMNGIAASTFAGALI